MTDAISLEVLRKSCQANGLPTSGNKDVLLDRLLKGQGDKRKQRKMSPKKETSDIPEDYVSKETELLRNAGFEDDDWIKKEVARRWEKMKPADAADITTLPVLLNAEQMASAKLVLIGNDCGMYKYIKSPCKALNAKASVDSEQKVNMTADPGHAAAVDESHASTASDAAHNSEAKKRKADEIDNAVKEHLAAVAASGQASTKDAYRRPDDSFRQDASSTNADADGDYMKFAMEFVTSRLLKHADKETMAPMLVKFGIPGKGAKTEMATALAEQLCYETGDEDDEEADAEGGK